MLHFFTANFNDRLGVWRITLVAIARHYIKKWFWVDAVSAFRFAQTPSPRRSPVWVSTPVPLISAVLASFFCRERLVRVLCGPTKLLSHKQPSVAPCAPVDQVSILPFDLIGFTSDSGGLSQLHIIRVVRLLRMLKLIRVLKVNRQGNTTTGSRWPT